MFCGLAGRSEGECGAAQFVGGADDCPGGVDLRRQEFASIVARFARFLEGLGEVIDGAKPCGAGSTGSASFAASARTVLSHRP